MRNSEQLRTDHIKALTTIAIIVFVVDATVYANHVIEKSEAYNETAEGAYEKDLSKKVTYDGDQVWRIYKHNDSVNDLVEKYDQNGSYSIWSNHPSTTDIFIRNDMLDDVDLMLNKYGIDYEVLIDDVQEAIDDENVPLTAAMQDELEGRKGHRMEWSSYHEINDFYNFLDYLEDTHPDVCSVQNIGKSVEGQPLRLLRISNGKPNASAIWIDGGIHAREWIAPAAVTYIIDYLVDHSDSLETDYYILPVVNPDGYRYSFQYDRLWRKNRRKGPSSTCSGVDLNRNFGYHWGGKGTSMNTCRETYPGTKPFSEPETEAIRNFFANSLANFKAYLSFHSYGQYILYPWGYDERLTPDYQDLDSVGREAARLMKKEGGDNTVYTVGNSAITLYPAAGGSDDWAKALLKIKYSYTIELRDNGKYGFILPARYIVPTAKEALAFVNVITNVIKT